MSDLWVSLAVLFAVLLLSEAVRQAAARLCPSASWIYLLEASCTFQLCACCHELKLLAETTDLDVSIGLALTYTLTVIHIYTFREATGNPSGVLESCCRGKNSFRASSAVIATQFFAAVASQRFAKHVWSVGMSEMHVKHRRFGYKCFDPLAGSSVLEAAAVELACAFAIQAAAMHAHKLDEKLRAHFIALCLTALVYAGGSTSGAVFNPILAFSIQFPCSGHTQMEYCFIYWLGPLLGFASCILLFEKIIPFLSGRSTLDPDTSSSSSSSSSATATHKQKTQ